MQPRPATATAGVTTRPASAAAGVDALLTGPARDGVVLGVLTEAVIVQVQTDHGSRVLCLLTARASGVPNGVRPAGVLTVAEHRVGDPVRVGGRRISTGGLDVSVVRSWPSAVRPIRPTPGGLADLTRAAACAERGVPQAAVESLRDACDQPGFGGSGGEPAVDALIGWGQGLTPGGDDVVAGLLIGLHATDSADLVRRITAVDRWSLRTTLLSADLLRLAAAGHACLEVLAVLAALHAGGPLRAATDRLLSVGHTSGADLATGLAIGLRVGACRQEAR